MEDKYKLFSASELAGEDSFIRWVMHGENDQAWIQWLKTYPDRSEVVDEARYIVKTMAMQTPTLIDAGAKAALWKRIQADVTAGHRNNNRNRQYRMIRLSLVAAAAIALLFWLNISAGIQKIIVDPGVTADIILPELSEVTVNAGSTVRYNEKHFKQLREIKLEGEAFFKVTPGSIFKVITPQGNVTVVGTSFNVIARPGRFEVNCYTGKVKVQQEENDKVEITGGQRCFTTRKEDKLEMREFDPSATSPDWTRGKFTFQNQPLTVVVSELERQYGVMVKLAPGIADMKYNGLFESGDLAKALYLVTWPLQLKYQISGKTVTISR